jgi:hypothetical protein
MASAVAAETNDQHSRVRCFPPTVGASYLVCPAKELEGGDEEVATGFAVEVQEAAERLDDWRVR